MKEKRKKNRTGPNKRSDLFVYSLIKRFKTRLSNARLNGLLKVNRNITQWNEK